MAQSNRERVGAALELLGRGLRPYFEREMQAAHGKRWLQVAAQSLSPNTPEAKVEEQTRDVYILLKVMWDQWNTVFGKKLAQSERTLISELRSTRNQWAHQEAFSTDDTYRALDSSHRLLTAVSAEQAADVDRQKQEVLRLRFEEQARKETKRAAVASTAGEPQAGLRSWREVVTPHPDVSSGRFRQAEFAADLAQVLRGEGSNEYRDPPEFFRRTYLTEELRRLLSNALRRVSGGGGDPVIELRTNFGGGKTHALLALYHLFSGASASDLPGLEPVLKDAGADRVADARRAVLVGTAISPGQPHHKPDGTEVRTLWGELGWQLGGREGYKIVAEADATATNPGDALVELFGRYSPCLILIDEWVAYARQLYGLDSLPAGSFDTHFTFAQALTETVRAATDVLLVISVPASERISDSDAGGAFDIEIGGEGGRAALERLENVIGRIQAPRRLATPEESFEIVKRRLFQPVTDPNAFAARDAVVKAFADLYRTQTQEFPQGSAEGEYKRKLEGAYPIHPELFDRLYGGWSTLPEFQQTRGVLRLLAAVIHALWVRQDGSLAIMPGSVPIDDSTVQFELTRYLPANWAPVIDRDIDGPNSIPLAIDQENPNLGRYSTCRRVARTIYLGSAPTLRTAQRGIEDRSIKLGCVQPGEPPAVFGDALRHLTDRAHHLYVDGKRYWFDMQPSVARVAQERAAQWFDADDVGREIVRRLREETRSRGDFAAVHVAPENTGAVRDDPEARLVILGPDSWHSAKTAESPARARAAEILEQHGSGPRRHRNMLVFLAPDKSRVAELEQAVRQYLAWKSIDEQHEELNLDAFQENQARTKHEQANQAVEQRIPEAYQWAVIPSQPDAQGSVGWEEVRTQGQESLAVRTSRKLRSDEFLITELGAVRLRMELDRIPLWRGDHVGVKQLWEDFAQYLYLPRLRDSGVLVRAVEDGVATITWQDSFAYAEGWDEAAGRYLGLRAGEHGGALLDGQSVLVKPTVAAEQLTEDRKKREGAAGVDTEKAVDTTGGTGDIAAGAVEGVQAKPRRFHGNVQINPTRLSRDAADIAEAIVQHLTGLVGSNVDVSVEIQAEIPEGAPDDVVRTVTENAKTLKFREFGFEPE
jgi:predicted AAA+ superfamily ATPase